MLAQPSLSLKEEGCCVEDVFTTNRSRNGNSSSQSIFFDEEWENDDKSHSLSTTSIDRDLFRSKVICDGGLNFNRNFHDMARKQRAREWMVSLHHTDPRWQIMKFFNDVAHDGADKIEEIGIKPELVSPLTRMFCKASVFSVWRPTSFEAIRKMMTGEGTGKGLEIKGKSAKRGVLSAFVPFVQIYEEGHKGCCLDFLKSSKTVRVFYSNEELRNEAFEAVRSVTDAMMSGEANEAEDTTQNERSYQNKLRGVLYRLLNELAPDFYGIEMNEFVFWEAFVMSQECNREANTEHDTGRPSVPAFQEMNFKATRHQADPGDPHPVVLQVGREAPMDPRTLVVAYEEDGSVKPVVSDFDGFIIGTRNVRYEEPLPPDQVDLLQRTISHIEAILDDPCKPNSWTACWLDVLKEDAKAGIHLSLPKYGLGDNKSYSIMRHAIGRLKGNGAVRHGAECFNYYFPQELDEEFLVISDTLPEKSFKYVNVQELQDILCEKIDEGFTFPLNPKWVLCDPGWKRVYDKMLASEEPNVQNSLDAWFPPKSGIRERIGEIYLRHPGGFAPTMGSENLEVMEGTEAMDLAELELEVDRCHRIRSKTLAVAKFSKLMHLTRASLVYSPRGPQLEGMKTFDNVVCP